MSANVFLKKLRLRNFRSVRDTEITFDNPLFLVGRNGSGKSNVVDAIAFLSDCMNSTLKAAIEEKRDGLARITNVDASKSWPFIEFNANIVIGDSSRIASQGSGFYRLRLRIENREYTVDTEECLFERDGVEHYFRRSDNTFEASVSGLKPRLGSQSLALPIVGGVEEFAPIADGLASMRVYHIDHRKIRAEEGTDASPLLNSNGGNVAGVLSYLKDKDFGWLGVQDALHPITPTSTGFFPVELKNGGWTLLGTQRRETQGGMIEYDRSAFSDGTLYALGLAVALNQNPLPSVIVIEEPENNLHPGALAGISDLIHDASRKTQVIITTHSPDLLDAKWIKPENLRVVVWENDASRVAELAERPKEALRTHLMYAGQLMRANALDPAPAEENVMETEAQKPAPAAP